MAETTGVPGDLVSGGASWRGRTVQATGQVNPRVPSLLVVCEHPDTYLCLRRITDLPLAAADSVEIYSVRGAGGGLSEPITVHEKVIEGERRCVSWSLPMDW